MLPINSAARLVATAGSVVATLAVISPAAAQAPKDTLRVAMYANASTLGNPFAASYSPGQYFYSAVFDTLVRVDDSGKAVPWVAESWKVIDATTWQFKLRPDVMFSNGARLDARAVQGTFDWLLGDGKATTVARFIPDVVGARAVDDLTIEIKTKVPSPVLARQLATIFFIEPKAWSEMGVGDYARKPVTTGPWQVEKWTEAEAEFVAFPQAWRKPKVNRLSFRVLGEEVTRQQALISDQVDIAVALSPEQVKNVEAAGHKAVVYAAPFLMSWVLFTNDFPKKYGDKGSPFADKRVRMAANLALDRQAISDGLLNGLAKPANQLAMPATFGYNPKVRDFPYDPARAKALLSEAGYPNGFDMVAEVYVGGIAKDTEIYNYAADALSKIGIRVELRQLAFNDYLSKINNGTWQGLATGRSIRHEPLMDLQRPLDTFSCRERTKAVCVEEHMPLITAASSEMNESKREALLQEIMQKSHDDALLLFLVNGPEIYGLNKRAKNLAVWNQVILYEKVELN